MSIIHYLRKSRVVQKHKETIAYFVFYLFPVLAAMPRRLLTRYKLRNKYKIQLGVGPAPAGGWSNGWANVDIMGRGNIIWDLRVPLPIQPGTVRFFYTEHFIEHITREDVLNLLRSCHQVLQVSGVIRIATPNLLATAQDYLAGVVPIVGDWRPKSPCAAFNQSMRFWGHQYIYDAADLTELLNSAGFSEVKSMPRGQSEYEELCALETRSNRDDLILEATK